METMNPQTVLAGFESTMETLRTMPIFDLEPNRLLGMMSVQGSPAWERGQWLAVRHFSALRALTVRLGIDAL